MDKIKVLFLCGEQSPWGYAHLKPLLHDPRFQVVAVILATEDRWRIFRKALSGEQQSISAYWKARVKRLAGKLLRRSQLDNTESTLNILKRQKIPVMWCDDVNAIQTIESFRMFSPELLFSAAYPQIFKAQLLTAFPRGAFNSHPSLLPRCRGAHPVFWTIASGESKSGSTIHIMTPILDKGDIVAQVKVELLTTDTHSQLYAKLIATIPSLLTEFANFLIMPHTKSKPQCEAEATYFRNDREIHRRIFWSEMDATQIHNLVRACDGSAYFWHENQRIVVKSLEPLTTNRNLTNNIKVPAGTIVDDDNGAPIVATRNGFVKLTQIRTPQWQRFHFGKGMVLS